MERLQDVCPRAAEATASVSSAAAKQPATPSLQDLVGVPGLGALIMEAVPLADRVRMRGLGHAFKASVDASLQALQRIGPDDLFALDKRGRLEGGPLMWLAAKCPNLQVFEAQRASGLAVSEGTLLAQHWWKLPVADAVVTHLATHCRRIHTLSLLGCKGVSDAGLRAVAANCGGLTHLEVSSCLLGFYDCDLITDASVSAIAAGCQQLEHLDVGGNKSVSDASMMAVATHCPRLQHLNIRRTCVSDAGVSAIARGCVGLRTLDVRGCRGVGDAGVAAVAEDCPLLENLKYYWSGVGDRGIAAVMFNCMQLKKLDLTPEISDAAIRLAPASCRELHSLTIDSNKFTDASVSALAARCSALRHLHFGDVARSDACVTAFAASCPLLEELRIFISDRVTDASVLAVAHNCPQLHTLYLSGCRGTVTDAGLVELVRRCPRLCKLKLSKIYAGNRTFLAIAQHCPGLRSLDMSGHPFRVRDEVVPTPYERMRLREWEDVCVKDDGLAAVLQNCLQLEVLNLVGWDRLTDAGITMVGDSCRRLRKLDVSELCGGFTDQGLAAMAPNLGALEVLRASSCDAVTDVSLVALARHCPRLKDADVSFCEVGDEGITALVRHCALVKLRAAGCTRVSDVGMAAISERCGQLVGLSISRCGGVSNTGIMAVVSRCSALRSIDIDKRCMTERDVQAVRDAWPNLDIDFV
eukprot:jgi/Mesvir1/591/Mv02032-RA.1